MYTIYKPYPLYYYFNISLPPNGLKKLTQQNP